MLPSCVEHWLERQWEAPGSASHPPARLTAQPGWGRSVFLRVYGGESGRALRFVTARGARRRTLWRPGGKIRNRLVSPESAVASVQRAQAVFIALRLELEHFAAMALHQPPLCKLAHLRPSPNVRLQPDCMCIPNGRQLLLCRTRQLPPHNDAREVAKEDAGCGALSARPQRGHPLLPGANDALNQRGGLSRYHQCQPICQYDDKVAAGCDEVSTPHLAHRRSIGRL
mmetsp:Transcript_27402/g.88482  ORF Transcript_27402/g.88482 Transcript_27402/m.88482 type:complete len:227 (+) Transcript_27402:204-884(+)|eukprot:scaffold21265_cov131-Isochrysis_galbana.AAC.3